MDLIKEAAAKICYENRDLDWHLERKTEGAREEKMCLCLHMFVGADSVCVLYGLRQNGILSGF